jgi:hypothetical protein
VTGNSTNDRLGCIDADGDGWSNLSDFDDADPDVWSDSDEDGFPDQLASSISDDCPGVPGTSNEVMRGCPDLDGDGLPDLFDDDIDGDGISNSMEAQAGFNAWDKSDVPEDYDKDGIPDVIDSDDDNDGFPDLVENDRGSDSQDASETPLNMYGGGLSGFFFTPGGGVNTSYVEGGFELSLSLLLSLAQTELIVPLILTPPTIMLARRKKRRYKRMKRTIRNAESLEDLQIAEKLIDEMIEKGKVRIEQGVLLRNTLERHMEPYHDTGGDVPMWTAGGEVEDSGRYADGL